MEATEIRDRLRNFTGDLDRFRSINPNVIYTPGVAFLAQSAECYWLINEIAIRIQNNVQLRVEGELYHWELRLTDNGFSLVCHDGGANSEDGETKTEYHRFDYDGYTSFPLEEGIDIWQGYNELGDSPSICRANTDSPA